MVVNIAEESKLLSLGWGHNVRDSTLVCQDLCGMLQDSRLVGLDNGYLAEVVSICEYTVSNKG